MDKDEALKLALKALRFARDDGYENEVSQQAITAIKQALAAPVQDLPFGVGGGLVAIKTLLSRDPCVHANTAIEMIDAILKEHPAAQPAPVQPVAHRDGFWCADLTCKKCYSADFRFKHTTPPAAQRPWVGLTDEQFQAIRNRLSRQDGWDCDSWDLALKEAIEAKLKEKNNG